MSTRAFHLPLFYIVVSLVALLSASLRPFYNWDLIPYLACAKEIETDDSVEIHRFAYSELEKISNTQAYSLSAKEMVTPFRVQMRADYRAFSAQLDYYRIRVVYIFLLYLLISAGMDPVFATHFISALAIFLGSILLFFIGRGRLGTPFRYLLLPIGLGIGMMESARLSTPDGLAFLGIMGAVFLFLRGSSLLFLLLPLLVAVRTDLVILASLLCAVSLLMKREHKLLPLGSVALSIGGFFFLQWYCRYPGWKSLLYYPSSGPIEYLIGLAKGAWIASITPEFLFFSAIAGSALYLAIRLFKGKSFREMIASKPLVLLMVSLGYIAIHLLLFPQPATRFLVGPYVAAALSLFMFASSMLDPKWRPQDAD